MMNRKRVHELAKELGMESKEIVRILQAAGHIVKNHMSIVYEDEARPALRQAIAPATQPTRRPGMTIVRRNKPTGALPGA